MSGKGVMVGTEEEIAREIARKLYDERRGHAEPCDEFLKFRKLLDGAGIPWHDASTHIEGDGYSYHMHRTHGDGFSVIYGIGSYGREAGLLEARVEGDVTGWLTAEEAFEMVRELES
jgi:hypothetical protein